MPVKAVTVRHTSQGEWSADVTFGIPNDDFHDDPTITINSGEGIATPPKIGDIMLIRPPEIITYATPHPSPTPHTPSTIHLPFFTWCQDQYPLIASLANGFHLVAHKNAPAITNGDIFLSLDIHAGDNAALTNLKIAAWAAYREWSWKLLRPLLDCPTYEKKTPHL